ncbi:MAG TPA: histidine kinase [Chitinophagaceae bacterium]|nr:histidine kinase [Chitinophagaceae bacterium]
MKEPGTLEYVLLIATSLIFALAGLYLLINFSKLFKGRIRNELLRKNVAAFVIILLLGSATAPLSSSFFLMLAKHGWKWSIISQIVYSLIATILVYNAARLVVDNNRLKKLNFLLHSFIVFLVLAITILIINIPAGLMLYGKDTPYLKYIIPNLIYIAGVTGIVYAVTRYQDIERKRKFDAKELELSKLRELKAKAELDALHSKVNPHFLYNALNSIADLSVTDGKKARQMTIALADLFRYSINYSNNNYSTIQDEIEMAEVYLQIEKIRFEDKLNYSINYDKELSHYLVPRFVIQPLVENAVKHGLKATGQVTDILLEVNKHGDGIVIIVSDTGPQFPDELNPGYGVKSVFDKMDLLFPGQYEIHFTNSPRKQVSIFVNKLIKNEPGV